MQTKDTNPNRAKEARNICPYCKADLNKGPHLVGIPHPPIMSIDQAYGHKNTR